MLSGAPPTAMDDTYAVPIDDPLAVESPVTVPGARITPPIPIPPHGHSGGASIIKSQFLMTRFEISGLVRTSQIGGLIGGSGGNAQVFGAIVALSGPDDLPDSADLSTPDVLGHTLVRATDPATVNSGKLPVELAEGWYGLVFGTGMFGATTDGFAPTSDRDQTYTYFTSHGGWSSMPNHTFHFFVDAVGVVGGVLDNDSDPEGDRLTAELETPPAHGKLQLDADGTFTYTPEPGFMGTDSFRYTVSDSTSQRTATVWLGRPHAPPITTNDRYQVTEGQAFHGGSVLSNDFGQNLHAALLTGPEHGTLTFHADGTFIYTADPGRTESDQFLYRVRSGTLWSAPATVTLDIRDANNAPVANNDVYRIEPGETLISGIGEQLAGAIYFTDDGLESLNRIGLDGETIQRFRSLTFSASSIALDHKNNMVYWYIGAPEYRIYRGSLAGGPQQLVVQMPEVPIGGGARDNPSVRDLAIDVEAGKLYWTTNSVQSVYPAKVSRSNLDGTGVEDLWSVQPGFPQGIDLDLAARKVYWTHENRILRTDMDAPRAIETVVSGSGTGGSIVALALDVSRGKVYWAEGQSFQGARLRRANLDGTSAETVLELDREASVSDLAIDTARGKLYWSDNWFDTINRANLDGSDREVVLRNGLTNPGGFTLNQVFPKNYIYGVLANDVDVDGDSLTATIARGPQHGQLELNANGSFRYVPDAGFVGRDTFSYFASDGETQSGIGTVTIVVGNRAPVAKPDTYNVREDSMATVPRDRGVLANDEDEDPQSLRAVLISGPAHGTLDLSPDGAFIYRPEANFFGDDTFTYRASDGELLSEPTTVTLRVAGSNDAPITLPDEGSVEQGKTLVFPASRLTANDIDPDGDALTVRAVMRTANTHGTVSLANGTVTYTPEPSFSGNASFTYTVFDGNGGVAEGIMRVRVDPLPGEQNTAGQANGSGSLDQARRLFNFQVRSRPAGEDFEIDGHLTFIDFGNRMLFRATQITSFRIEDNGRVATFAGTGSLNGRAGYSFTVQVEDNAGAFRGRDRFRIEITGRGINYDSLDHAINGGRIDRVGDIRVQPRRRDLLAPAAQIPRDFVLAGWSEGPRYETLIEQLARIKGS